VLGGGGGVVVVCVCGGGGVNSSPRGEKNGCCKKTPKSGLSGRKVKNENLFSFFRNQQSDAQIQILS